MADARHHATADDLLEKVREIGAVLAPLPYLDRRKVLEAARDMYANHEERHWRHTHPTPVGPTGPAHFTEPS